MLCLAGFFKKMLLYFSLNIGRMSVNKQFIKAKKNLILSDHIHNIAFSTPGIWTAEESWEYAHHHQSGLWKEATNKNQS